MKIVVLTKKEKLNINGGGKGKILKKIWDFTIYVISEVADGLQADCSKVEC